MLALPCCRRCGSVDWDGGAAEGASAIGSEEPPPTVSTAACGGGGRARSMSATDLVAFAKAAAEPAGGDRRRGNARLLKAAEMRLKTSGSDEGGRSAGGDGGGGSRGADSAPVAPVVAEAEAGTGPGPSSPPAGGGEKGSATPPHPLAVAPLPRVLPVSPVRCLAFRGPGVVGPQGGGGASTQRSWRCRAPAGRRRA